MAEVRKGTLGPPQEDSGLVRKWCGDKEQIASNTSCSRGAQIPLISSSTTLDDKTVSRDASRLFQSPMPFECLVIRKVDVSFRILKQ